MRHEPHRVQGCPALYVVQGGIRIAEWQKDKDRCRLPANEAGSTERRARSVDKQREKALVVAFFG